MGDGTQIKDTLSEIIRRTSRLNQSLRQGVNRFRSITTSELQLQMGKMRLIISGDV